MCGWVNEQVVKTRVLQDWVSTDRNIISCDRKVEIYCNWSMAPYATYLGYDTIPPSTWEGAIGAAVPTEEDIDLSISVEVARAPARRI